MQRTPRKRCREGEFFSKVTMEHAVRKGGVGSHQVAQHPDGLPGESTGVSGTALPQTTQSSLLAQPSHLSFPPAITHGLSWARAQPCRSSDRSSEQVPLCDITGTSSASTFFLICMSYCIFQSTNHRQTKK